MNSSPKTDRQAPGMACIWAQYGPYHFARVAALRRLAEPSQVYALEFSDISRDYLWDRSLNKSNLITLCPGSVSERLPFATVFGRSRRKLAELRVSVCFVPSYSPKQSLAALLAAKSLGLRTVMMNESHAGTARARGVSALLKHWAVGLFDAALVGGRLQKRYFASLGIPSEKIFTGYDAIDNAYFSAKAKEARTKSIELRFRYSLPEHYFLSLGRFVAKKNLPVLIRAFRRFLDATRFKNTHLVLVGSGDDQHQLKALCRGFGLPVYEKQPTAEQGIQIANRKSQIANDPGVHFYGFRQIEENPVFYALADAFVLPSLYEEWGLVVNEAMAASLPVAVSETAGCAEDLLEPAEPDDLSQRFHSQLKQLNLVKSLRSNGFVFNPNSSDELSRVLLFLDSSPEIRTVMGQASHRIVESFSCDNFARNALLACQAALGRNGFQGFEPKAVEQTGTC